ncbi:MAG TPA: divergent polysaccharide deacetylase family protein [Candidatus Krumholzibacteria bacterium]|nr:divergent polysaccharide deacetylase family protein [Candidatus Krumholzibacteria bacterium]
MARAKKTKDEDEPKNSRVPGSVKLFTFLLVVLAIGGSIGINYLKTTRGAVFLTDHGAVMAYGRAQRDASRILKAALETENLRRNVRVIKDAANPEARQAVQWDVPCDEKTDLLKVNVALSEAAEAAGLVIRRSEEFDKGKRVELQVGTHTLDTHRITLRLASAAAIAREIPPPEKRAKLALVFDDFGYERGGIPREVIDLDIALTITILPTLRYSQDILAMAKRKSRCVLLHVPMESEKKEKSDVDEISVGMNDKEIANLVRSDLESLPGVDGVSNHEGSLATTDARVMQAVMNELSGRNLLYFDSLTSPKSVAYNVAVATGLRAAQNNLFLDDNTERSDDVTARLHELVELAKKNGVAIGIGHPHPWTFEAIRDNLDYLKDAGVDLVTVCDLAGKSAMPDSLHTER